MEIIKEGHQLLGIISTHHETFRWAKQNNISILASLLEFQELNPYKEFDYLFSIVNSQILPSAALQLPIFSAINYHNAPLPRYAGVNATSWAILNQEKIHGVTWHEMTRQVDAGDIIRRATFPINGDDTALTLNLRCYEYAIKEFKSLLYDIKHNKINKIEQDLSKRSFYALNKKLFGGGVIDWKQDISYLERLSRALDFGGYPNLLSKLKILLPNNEVLYPVSLDCLTQNDKKQKNQAGEIINLNSNELVISCANGLIRIKDLYSRDGKRILLKDVNPLYGIKQGDCLPLFDKESLQYFTDYLALSDGDRRYWQDRLEGVERLELPWSQNAVATSETILKRIEFTQKRKEEELIGYILIYLAKLAQTNKISFKYIDADTIQQIVQSNGLCVGKIINISINPRDTIKEVIANIKKQLVIAKNDARKLSVDVAYELSYNSNIEIISDVDNVYDKNKYTKLNSKDIRFVLDKQHKYIDVITTKEQDSKVLDNITNHIV
jgi:methionyl-tRNA formyltransferase